MAKLSETTIVGQLGAQVVERAVAKVIRDFQQSEFLSLREGMHLKLGLGKGPLQKTFRRPKRVQSLADGLGEKDRALADTTERLGKARQPKQTMMQQLLTGRIRLV